MPYLIFNIVLAFALALTLILNWFGMKIPMQFFQTLAVVAFVPVLLATIKSIKERQVSVDFLAAAALIVAFIAGEWKSAAFINLMLSSARIFDIWTTRRSDKLVKSLLKYRPEKVKVKNGNKTIIKDVDYVRLGDILIIGEGERIAVDGVVISGQASIDESTLTGESFPKTKKVGDHVYSSTLNTSGSILIRTEKTAKESTLAKIITLVEKSSFKKSKIVKTVNTFAKWYILATFTISVTLYVLTGNIDFVLAILLVVCADDIAVSIPLAFTVAISTAAKNGILIKSSDVLERLPRIDVFITDKTGTLTSARPKIVKIETFNKTTQKEALNFLIAAEINSNHPVAHPIIEYARKQNILAPAITEFKETPGEGIEVLFKKMDIIAGKYDFLKKMGVKAGASVEQTIEQYLHDGYSIVALGVNKKIAAIVIFEDELKPSAKSAIKATRSLGVKTWIMLTGDNEVVAKKVSEYAGIDLYRSQLMPSGKLEFVEKYKKENKEKSIAMIGDGVNDAAALAIADTSFAMGVAGSDAAINASDVAIMNDNLEKIPEAIELGRATRRVSYINFGIWGITNAVGLMLVFAHILNPTGAAAYNFLTDFLPIFNAFGVTLFKRKSIAI